MMGFVPDDNDGNMSLTKLHHIGDDEEISCSDSCFSKYSYLWSIEVTVISYVFHLVSLRWADQKRELIHMKVFS